MGTLPAGGQTLGKQVAQPGLGRDHVEARQMCDVLGSCRTGRQHRQAVPDGKVGGELDQVAQLGGRAAYAVLGDDPGRMLGNAVPGPGGRMRGAPVQRA
ncbi:hypothetical protein [Nocardioides acrostichi]|uniref:Uncharacterized protein n=1 Tax=Nocardioides acrostichi TaxID=2784339 RepID=A0A930YCM5_9ACTN|nr:hypothetical protein [Nocardioides acrostichi]MBF4163658.1 hypothetical protein [Nocardioides acrostichi]